MKEKNLSWGTCTSVQQLEDVGAVKIVPGRIHAKVVVRSRKDQITGPSQWEELYTDIQIE
jgi:hypothetical protein